MKKYKLNKVLITLALIGTGFIIGNENGKQVILDRWEDRWFESDWYDKNSIEDILKDQAYWDREDKDYE